MAYYHGSIKLNRWEEFELNGDREQANKQLAPLKHKYGTGIAAQFGLVKKTASKSATARPFTEGRDVRYHKRKNRLSEDNGDHDDKSRNIGKKKKKKTLDRPMENRRHLKEMSKADPREIDLWGILGCSSGQDSDEMKNKDRTKLKKKAVRIERTSVSSPSNESADSGDETRMEKRQSASSDTKQAHGGLHFERLQRVAEERAVLLALKRRNREAQQEETEKQMEKRRRKKEKAKMMLKKKERVEKRMIQIIHDSDEEELKMSKEVENEHKDDQDSSDKRLKQKGMKILHNTETWERPLQGKYQESEEYEEEEDDTEQDDNEEKKEAKGKKLETDRRKKYKQKEVLENTQHDEKCRREAKRGRDEQCNPETFANYQNVTIRDVSEQRRKSEGDDVRNGQRDDATAEKKKKKEREKVPTEKETHKDKTLVPNSNKEPETLLNKKAFTNPKFSGSTERPAALVTPSDTSTQKMTRVSEKTKTEKHSHVQNQIQCPISTCIGLSNEISQKSTSVRRERQLKAPRSSSPGTNDDTLLNLFVTPAKAVNRPKSSIMKEKARKITAGIPEIKSKPVDHQSPSPSLPHTDIKDASHEQSSKFSHNDGPNLQTSFVSLDDKPSSLLRGKDAPKQTPKKVGKNEGGTPEDDAPVKVNLDASTTITRDTSKNLFSAKGDDLSDWLRSVVMRLDKKSTHTDNPSLKFFIALHSRFKVLTETGEMRDLEVLPEVDSEDAGQEAIRILTNMRKGDYQQHIDEPLLNSIPEIIITRLYGGGSGRTDSDSRGIGNDNRGTSSS